MFHKSVDLGRLKLLNQTDINNLFVSDGSQFTSGAAENPTLTIVSLAIRQAEFIARSLASKDL